MIDCDLAFEKSDVEADIVSEVISIKNPRSGKITLEGVGEIIMDDPLARGKVYVKKDSGESVCAKKTAHSGEMRKIA